MLRLSPAPFRIHHIHRKFSLLLRSPPLLSGSVKRLEESQRYAILFHRRLPQVRASPIHHSPTSSCPVAARHHRWPHDWELRAPAATLQHCQAAAQLRRPQHLLLALFVMLRNIGPLTTGPNQMLSFLHWQRRRAKNPRDSSFS